MRKILRGHVFNIRFLLTLCLGFAFSAIHAQVSGTFTINSAVATGSGNFQTFTAAVASLAGGVNGPVTFNVQAGSGPYNEQVVLNNIAGTSTTNTITFNCNGVTLTFLSTNTNNRAGIKLDNTDFVTFDNLTIVTLAATNTQYGYGFHLLNDADNNTIKNCHLNLTANPNRPDNIEGIVINGNNSKPTTAGNSNCDNNLIINNVIDGAGNGITLSSAPLSGNTPVLITGNKILNNTITNFLSSGIEVYYTSGTQIDGNELVGGPNAYFTTGITLGTKGSLNQSVSVTNNRIHDLLVDPSNSGGELYGIKINSFSIAGKENLIANNLLYNFSCDGLIEGICSTDGSFVSGVITYGASFFNVYNNTVSLDDQTQVGLANTEGLYFEWITDVNVKNNIVTVSRPTSTASSSTTTNYGIHVSNVAPRLDCDHNVIYVQAGNFGSYNGNPLVDLKAWIGNTGLDHFSIETNPLYTNLSGANLRPTAQLIDNRALYVNINTDITSAVRNTSAPDPGCYEFTSAACSTPITGGSAILVDSVMCQGPKIALSLSGNSGGNGQTYTWQTATSATGTFSNLSGAQVTPYFETTPTGTFYYRVAVTCGATTAFSSMVKVLVTSPLNGGTYTINKALPTGGINYNSFNDAIKGLACGFNGNIIFNVASGSGPYNEQLIIPALPTSPTKTITFNGNGTTITFLPTNPDESAVIKLNGADYITFDSLTVTVQGTTSGYGFGFGIQLLNDADNNTIKRCTVNLNNSSASDSLAGIVINGHKNNPRDETADSYCDNNIIANNKINGGYVGISCASRSDLSNHSTLTGNIVRKNTLIDNCAFGIFIAGAANLLVDSNDISQPARTVYFASMATVVPFSGIYVSAENHNVTITRNRIHDLLKNIKSSVLQLDGIALNRVKTIATEPVIITNNEIYNFFGNGVQDGLYSIFTDYVKFYHNTISLEDTAGFPILDRETRGIGFFGAGTTGVEVKDNSFVIKRGGAEAKYCIYLDYPDSSLSANYNNYYMRANGGTENYIGRMGTQFYPTLGGWLATRKDANSISIDPVHNDLAKGDLTPTKLLFENRGSNVGITTDLLNTPRNTTSPDIGAIEFTICRPLSKPMLAVESAETNLIKFVWTSVPNTTGYRVSRDKLNWSIPSSGAMGLSHTVTGLKPTDKITLWVKALGTRVDCPEYISDSTDGQALTDGVFVPNTFTPNNDGRNDFFKVYSNVTKSIHWMVFNQWGQKVFEANDINGNWDGTYKGKLQPVGVYVYVVSGMLTDGTKLSKKGTFNLVR
jgi:gliding motility-associated-like protein